MKNKGVVYLLLVVVGIVWYNVFFRIKDNFFTEETVLPSTENRTLKRPTFHRDTFQLHADYRDPFHGVTKTEEVKTLDPNVVNTFTPPKPTPPPPKPHHWPKIKYFGLVKNQNAKSALCILQIGNSLYNLREGEMTQDNIEVRRITRDSVILAQGKYGKVVKK
jgi:hypothetical protein